MDEVLYDGTLNNVIAYYGLLVAILLPVIILLAEGMKDSPRIDKQVLFKVLLPVSHFGVLLGVFVLPIVQCLIFNSSFLENVFVKVLVAAITVITTIYALYSIIRMATWILSGENKEAFHGFYRQNMRIGFLNKGNAKEKCDKWLQFWSDEKTIKYFGNDICSYIDEYFYFLHSLKRTEWEIAKGCCAQFYYDIPDLYNVGKGGIRINAYDDESLARQLIKTVPFCVCDNIVTYIDDLVDGENGGLSFQCGLLLTALLAEIGQDDDSKNVEWVTAFDLNVFGIKKKQSKALALAVMITSYYQRNSKTKRDLKKTLDKMMNASGCKYIAFYKQLYKETFNFNPNHSLLLEMMKKGA